MSREIATVLYGAGVQTRRAFLTLAGNTAWLIFYEFLCFCVPVAFPPLLLPSPRRRRRRQNTGSMATLPGDEPGDMNAELVQSPIQISPQSTVADSQTPEIDLVPVRPKQSTRYSTRDRFVHQVNHFITPLLYCDPTEPYLGMNGALPDGWDKYIHPEGALYYVNHEHHIVTSIDVYDPTIVTAIHEARKEIQRRMALVLPEDRVVPYIREHRQDVSLIADWHWGLPEYELMLELDGEATDEGKHRFNYYCADWQRCCIFWVENDPFDGPFLSNGAPQDGLSAFSLHLDAPVSYDQLELTLKSEFWMNVEHFPSHRDLSPEWLPRLKSILKCAALDRMTSLTSTVSAPINLLEQALDGFPEAGDDREYINIFAGKHLAQIFFDRSFNLYGTPQARIGRRQSHYAEPQPLGTQSVLGSALRILSCVFIFGEAGSFQRALRETWVDEIILMDRWLSMLRDVQNEWNSKASMATVLLAANMAFLAINQLGGDSSDNSSKGGNELPVFSQVLSVTSTLFSLGTILSGMVLKHQHRALASSSCTAREINTYVATYADRETGTYSTAMLYSMPFGMLLWSFFLFISGVLSFSFARFSHRINPVITATTGIILVVIATQLWYFRSSRPMRYRSTWKLPSPDPGDDGEGVAIPLPRHRAWARAFAKTTLSRGLPFGRKSRIAAESDSPVPDLESTRGSPRRKFGRFWKTVTSSTTKQRARDGSDAALQTVETSSPNTVGLQVLQPAVLPVDRGPSVAWLPYLARDIDQQGSEMTVMESLETAMTQQTLPHSPLLPTIMSSPPLPPPGAVPRAA